MAGSYAHVEQHGWSLVENMGDAAETAKELLWLVWHFARLSLGPHASVETIDLLVCATLDQFYYPMCRGERPKDDLMLAVEERMNK